MKTIPRIAVCLYGSLGYKQTLFGQTNQNQTPLDIEEPIDSLLTNVIIPNNADTFIHSWSIDRKKRLVEKLNPKLTIFENHKQFAKDINSIKNSVRSRFYSQQKSNSLKKEFEKNNQFIYDVVLHTRMDLMWFNKLSLNKNIDNNFYASHWNISKKSDNLPIDKSNDNNNLGPFDKSNYGLGSGLIDHWFFSSSKNMDKFSEIYYDMRKLEFTTWKNSLKQKKKLKNVWSYNPNHFCYIQANKLGADIKYVLFRGYDYDLYRRYKNPNYFKK